MESQPQNPELRINPENIYPCLINFIWIFSTFKNHLGGQDGLRCRMRSDVMIDV